MRVLLITALVEERQPLGYAGASEAAEAWGVVGAVHHNESERRPTSRVHTVNVSDKNKHKTGVKGVRVLGSPSAYTTVSKAISCLRMGNGPSRRTVVLLP